MSATGEALKGQTKSPGNGTCVFLQGRWHSLAGYQAADRQAHLHTHTHTHSPIEDAEPVTWLDTCVQAGQAAVVRHSGMFKLVHVVCKFGWEILPALTAGKITGSRAVPQSVTGAHCTGTHRKWWGSGWEVAIPLTASSTVPIFPRHASLSESLQQKSGDHSLSINSRCAAHA